MAGCHSNTNCNRLCAGCHNNTNCNNLAIGCHNNNECSDLNIGCHHNESCSHMGRGCHHNYRCTNLPDGCHHMTNIDGNEIYVQPNSHHNNNRSNTQTITIPYFDNAITIQNFVNNIHDVEGIFDSTFGEIQISSASSSSLSSTPSSSTPSLSSAPSSSSSSSAPLSSSFSNEFQFIGTQGTPIKSDNEENQCVVCLTHKSTHVFIPCGHKCVCIDCAKSIGSTTAQCPCCRGTATGAMMIYE